MFELSKLYQKKGCLKIVKSQGPDLYEIIG
jgi:hypothetical protein